MWRFFGYGVVETAFEKKNVKAIPRTLDPLSKKLPQIFLIALVCLKLLPL